MVKTAMVKPKAKVPPPKASYDDTYEDDLKEIVKQLGITNAYTVIYKAGAFWTIHLEGEIKHREIIFAKGKARYA
jgi:hypothetical protein